MKQNLFEKGFMTLVQTKLGQIPRQAITTQKIFKNCLLFELESVYSLYLGKQTTLEAAEYWK